MTAVTSGVCKGSINILLVDERPQPWPFKTRVCNVQYALTHESVSCCLTCVSFSFSAELKTK